MTISEFVSTLMNFFPYLNTGIIVLIISLGLDRLGFKITRRDYKKKPLHSLLWGLCLVILSGLVSLLIQGEMSGFQPLFAFFVLLAAYLVLTQV